MCVFLRLCECVLQGLDHSYVESGRYMYAEVYIIICILFLGYIYMYMYMYMYLWLLGKWSFLPKYHYFLCCYIKCRKW